MSGSISSTYESNAKPIAAVTQIAHCMGVRRAAGAVVLAVVIECGESAPAATDAILRPHARISNPRRVGARGGRLAFRSVFRLSLLARVRGQGGMGSSARG